MGQKINSLIYVLVDGVEKASFDLSRVSSTRFNLNKDAKEIALYRSGSEEREFLEAFPTDFANILNRPFTQNFNLKGGGMVKFQFVPIEEDGKVNKINCGVTFMDEETPAEQKVAAAPVVAAAPSDTAVAETATPKNAAATTVSTSTFEDRPLDGNRNRAFLIPAVVLLIALLVLSVGWFTLRGGKDNQIAKENNPDKKKEITNPVTKAKKEDVIKDHAVLPDDISGGGDGGDDEENVSADKKSSVNADSKTTVSDSTPSKKSLVNSTNPVRNRGVADVAENNKKRTKVSEKSIRKTLSAKSNRINADKFDINKPDSSLEARRTPVKQKSPNKKATVSSLNKVDSAISNEGKNERSNQIGQRITEDQKLSNTEKSNVSQGLSDKSLLEIKKVYLKWEGDVDTGILINQKVIEEIRDANLFALMQKKEDADAELRINIKYEKDGNSPKNPLVTANMWLTNDFGTVLTPTAENGKTLWKYDGKLEKMPEKIISDVNGLVTEAKKKKEQSIENTANVEKAELPKTIVETSTKPPKPITNETAVLNENIKPVNKIDAESSQISKNQIDKNPEGKSLTDIKKVYLEWQGDIDTGVKINQDLVETIQHSGMMNVMKEKKDADGTLKINIKKESDSATAKNPKVSADMWLVNDQGKTLTPMANGKTAWKYSGELKKMPKKVIDDIGGLVKAEKKKNQ
ncbi:MAG: hypothetical protein ACR2J3_07870 [Aridibacter sp.]